ncbi:MAG: permease-like cell division protein FtsX [Candidatus Pacebacteria bacterium]|jgi:cell division transport system permease protein|nr:permease-like cell division protein FtsX [Candidatus Paceibacterota bacterium]|tara:strand:+ start:47249 stop:48178 length:930 start_codon:yes stop_codon:yes gene_type:complete
MIWINIKRIIKSGFVSFWRNSVVSFASILVMTMTLFVLGSILFVGATLEASLNQIRNKVDINVYFVTEAPEEDILSLRDSLESLPEISSIEYVSREEALFRFRARHENDQLTLQALDELGENPLGANLNIKAKETSQYEGIAEFLEDESALSTAEGTPIIDKVNYFQNKNAIDKLTRIIDSSETFSFIIIAILVIASIIITFNTIRLAIYTSKDEISVMKLVGASNSYIRGPFVFEGIMYGVVSAIITLILFYPMTIWLGPLTENFFSDINLFDYYIDQFSKIFFIVLGSGVILGAVSSYLAVRKYLRK